MSLKKKMGAALATTALGAALIGGGTFALFTSSITNSGNTFTAGTVQISDITSTKPIASQAVNFNNLAPGDSGTVKMTVQNTGTLDEWVRIDQAASDATKGGTGLFSIDGNHLQLTYGSEVVKLAPGDKHDFNVNYSLPQQAGDSYQGKTGTFSVVVDAVQDRNNVNTAGNGPASWQ